MEYLQRIFLANAPLEGATGAQARQRARQLAERRAPGLVEEYEAIGGSPLNDQAAAQAATLEGELRDRGFDATTYVGMQFTEPFIPTAVEAARDDGVDRLVGLPIYPLCGPSTTVQALEAMHAALDDLGWTIPVDEVTGWHKHPTYNRLRAENTTAFATDRDIDLDAEDTHLVFSAHGTPRHYLEEGSRYDRYVEEYCATQAALLGVGGSAIGYQNHENRDIPWTEPAIDDLVTALDGDCVVVEPVSFMHEQSETLSELDTELRSDAEEAGLEFHRVPVPHDDRRFPTLLADLVGPFLADADPTYYNLHPCLCREGPSTYCLNAAVNRLTYADQRSAPTTAE